jgi:rsbT co-antagonist protein RsbR
MKNAAVQVLKKNKAVILEKWIGYQAMDEGLKEDLISNEDLRIQSEELLSAIIDNISEQNISDVESFDFGPIREQLAAISVSRARQGYSPRETAVFIFTLKDAINDVLHEHISDPVELFEQTQLANRLIDSFGITTFETFLKSREEVILRQTDEIEEISTPVIKVWDGIVALPIIGTLDSSRTQVVMENLLQQIVDTGSSIAILDISGVPAVDSLVAQHLIKTVSATRLMGAECIISGIRPEIAQTVVHLGIDLSMITTKATLASALKAAFSILSLEVRQKAKAVKMN